MQQRPGSWSVLDEHIYEEFKIFRIKRSGRINPRTGKRFDFFLMDGLDWVNVIALTAQNEVVLVRQFRHGAEQFTLEIPGGCVEPGEDPAKSVCRELLEETGFEVRGSLELLGTIHPNPAMQSMRCHCYLAHDAHRVSAQALDPGEDIESLTVPLSEVTTLITQGKITHSIVLAAFALWYARERGPFPSTVKTYGA